MKSNNNIVSITGSILSEVNFDHEIYGEKFFSTIISIMRTSGNTDNIPVLISEKLLTQNISGQTVRIVGSFRQRNSFNGVKNIMQLYVFADEISNIDAECYENSIELEGFLCKKAVFRTTPMQREIADMVLAVNRSFGKSDYIPCIAWSRNAKYAETLPVGAKVKAIGRIQSRTYIKKFDDFQEERTAYEVSISYLEIAE